ncbi:MAG TPA: gamma-glutamylcyclotransferase family protein [Candidatus Binatus sp.]|nr:gamma-glutamylcyclotransferase family protein [Candidatus Binatus sp.]
MTQHLFAYGTLLPGEAPPGIASRLAGLRPVARGTVPGRLYDLGRHPGAVLDASASGVVHGTVLRLPEDTALLAVLDAYEGFDSARPEQSLFVRVRAVVTVADDRMLDCWVYVYNRDPGGQRLLASGDYLAERGRPARLTAPGRARSSSRAPSRRGAPSR